MQDGKIDIKIKISALWVTMLFIFAYVDIFSFYVPEIIKGIMSGVISVFQINQTFLFSTTLYILIPCLMVFLSLVLKPAINRRVNIAVSIIYIITIVAGCIGQTWAYYLLGSAIEVLILIAIIWYCIKWPKVENK